MNDDRRLRHAVLALGLVIAIVVILYYGKGLLIPLAVAALLAMLFNPMMKWLERKGLGRGLAVTLCTLVLVLFVGGLVFLLGQQVASFADDWPQIKERATEQIRQIRDFVTGSPAVGSESPTDQKPGGGQAGAGEGGRMLGIPLPNISGGEATGLLARFLSVMGDFLLMLVYFVLLLVQKERLKEFVLRRAGAGERGEARRTIDEASEVAQAYLRGRLLLIAILAVIYSVGFSIFGLRNAIFIGIFGAFLSIIPYLGNLVAGFLAVGLAFVSGGDMTQVLGVVGVMAAAQVIESYVLEPLVVGQKVDINPLFTILVVIGFTILWGPVGAIVAIPIAGIVRIVFDHIDGLKDYAYLLSSEKK